MPYASFEALARCQTTSVVGRLLVETEVRRRVGRALEANGFDAAGFLEAMGRCNCVLAGRFVLSMVDPLGRETYDQIDVLAGDLHFAYTLFSSYLESEYSAYMEERLDCIEDFPVGTYHHAVRYTYPNTNRGAEVRIIYANHERPEFLVPHYPATHWMNYIAFDHIVVSYPGLMFSRRTLLTRRGTPSSMVSSFTIVSRGDVMSRFRCTPRMLCGRSMRWFNDDDSLIIGFPGLYQVCGAIHWRLGGEACNARCRTARLLVEEEGPYTEDEEND